VYGCTVRRSIADKNRSCNAAHWTGVSRASRSRTRVDLLGDEQPPIAPAQQDIGIVGDTVADDQRHHRIGIAVRTFGHRAPRWRWPTRSGRRGTARSLERRIAGEVRLEQVGRHDGVTVDLVLLYHHFQKPRQQRPRWSTMPLGASRNYSALPGEQIVWERAWGSPITRPGHPKHTTMLLWVVFT
jgi:hypothetical protein